MYWFRYQVYRHIVKLENVASPQESALCANTVMRLQSVGGCAPSVLQPWVCPRKISREPSHCPLAQCQNLPRYFSGLSQDILRTFSGLPQDSVDFLRTVKGLSLNSPRTFSWLSQDFLRTFSELFQDFLMYFSQQPKPFQRISHNFPRTFYGLSQDFLWTFSELSSDIQSLALIALALFQSLHKDILLKDIFPPQQ